MRAAATLALPASGPISLAVAADNLEAFPPADAGMTRHVIVLPQRPDEAAFKVELIIGRTVRVDPVNRHFFGGTLETENLPGWGFERCILRRLGPVAGTRMTVDPAAPKVGRLVSLGGEARGMRAPRGWGADPTPRWLAVAPLASALASPARAQALLSADEQNIVNFAFATQLGSGVHTVSGRTLQIYRLPFHYTLKFPDEGKFGVEPTLPVTLGFHDFEPQPDWRLEPRRDSRRVRGAVLTLVAASGAYSGPLREGACHGTHT